jgi:hypothetical protein
MEADLLKDQDDGIKPRHPSVKLFLSRDAVHLPSFGNTT